jgi:cobyrinic acid a,c-diamide synthase
MKGLLIAGTHSGVGKTTVTLALMAAFRRLKLTVQPFKVGPDFIDPGHHTAVTGRPSHNLDGWMLPRSENLRIFAERSRGADVVVVEGVMGLYDGASGLDESGSTAQMAKWLNLPILLVADARSMAGSLAAVALGYSRLDPGLTWAGLLANRVGSLGHMEMLAEAMTRVPGVPFLGGLSRTPDIGLGERHLGLITADETIWTDVEINRLADWIEKGLNIEELLCSLPDLDPGRTQHDELAPVADGSDRIRLGVARDEAFCFYYDENLTRLEQAGAQLVFFSPLHDSGLPEALTGLYIGGGYPEIFAAELSNNRSMREGVKAFGSLGFPVYAECGGLMYLGRSIRDNKDTTWPMTGLLPLDVRMLERRRSLGYRDVELTGETILGRPGLRARGHEFHYSEITEAGPMHSVYQTRDRKGIFCETEGFMHGRVLAGYVHLHFGSRPEMAANFVAACRAARAEGNAHD